MFCQRVLVILLLIGVCSCKKSSNTDEEFKEAFEKQEQVIILLNEVHQLLDSRNLETKDSLSEVIHELEETLFPIPGYSLNLPGHEGHDHGHSRVELTAKEILAVQEDLLQKLTLMKSDLVVDE